MDKIALVKRYSDVLDKDGQFIKALDQLYAADAYFESGCTDFLSPDIAAVIEEIARFETQVEVIRFGGYESAERVRMAFLPPYADPLNAETYITLLYMTYPHKFGKLGHKDLLGALMGLGITRQKVGDILPFEGGFQVIVSSDIADYISMSLDKVGRMRVEIKTRPLESVVMPQIDFQELSGTVSSDRLDSLVALAYGLSRNEAKNLIEQGLCKVNHRIVLQASKEVESSSLISCRGFGRFVLTEIGGETKKGRLRVSIKKYPT